MRRTFLQPVALLGVVGLLLVAIVASALSPCLASGALGCEGPARDSCCGDEPASGGDPDGRAACCWLASFPANSEPTDLRDAVPVPIEGPALASGRFEPTGAEPGRSTFESGFEAPAPSIGLQSRPLRC